MEKIKVIYWSGLGNTKMMADAIGEGITEAGKEAEILDVSIATVEELKGDSVLALGSPAMGSEVIEESEMEPFVEEFEKIASGKQVALFGSYGWGDGQWMREWEERMKSAGANIVNGKGIICQETPDDDMLETCKNLGRQLAAI